jgi:hypothetical protein
VDDYTWDLDPEDCMKIVIKKNGVRLFSIFLGEAMESAGRRAIMKHVRVCDNTPWLKKWHMDAMDQVVEILKGEENKPG